MFQLTLSHDPTTRRRLQRFYTGCLGLNMPRIPCEMLHSARLSTELPVKFETLQDLLIRFEQLDPSKTHTKSTQSRHYLG